MLGSVKKSKLIVVLVGGSCVGKTTLENYITKELGYETVTVSTTRKQRDDDKDNYNFLSDEEFELFKEDMDYAISTTEGTKYGYSIDPDARLNVVSFISSEEGKSFLSKFSKDDSYYTYILGITAPDDDIEECYKKRGMETESIASRQLAATNKYADDICDRTVSKNTMRILTNTFLSLVSKGI